MEIRKVEIEEIDTVVDLVNRVFFTNVAIEETEEGIETFEQSNTREFYMNANIITYVAIEDEKVVGMVSIRDENHISFLFVEPRYHHRGIASALMKRVFMITSQSLTVHSSLYAYKFYLAMGFHSTNIIQEEDGITYIPMVRKRNV